MLLDLTVEERDLAVSELHALGVRHPFGEVPADAFAVLGHIAMVLRFALVLRPDFRELRHAAALYDTWRNPIPAARAVQVDPAADVEPVEGPPPLPITLGGLLDIEFDPDPGPEVLERLLAGLRAVA